MVASTAIEKMFNKILFILFSKITSNYKINYYHEQPHYRVSQLIVHDFLLLRDTNPRIRAKPETVIPKANCQAPNSLFGTNNGTTVAPNINFEISSK